MKEVLTDRNGEPVVITATALTPIAYKHTFGEDMLKQYSAIRSAEDSGTKVDIFGLCAKAAFIMAKTAEHEKEFIKVMQLTDEDYFEFLNRFDSDYFQDSKTIGIVFGTWSNNAEAIDKAKNPQSPQKGS